MQAADAGESIGGAARWPRPCRRPLSNRLLDSARTAFDSGIAPTATIAAMLALIAAAVVALAFRGVSGSAGRPASAPLPAAGDRANVIPRRPRTQVGAPFRQRVRAAGPGSTASRWLFSGTLNAMVDDGDQSEDRAGQQVAGARLGQLNSASTPTPRASSAEPEEQQQERRVGLGFGVDTAHRGDGLGGSGAVQARMTKVENA